MNTPKLNTPVLFSNDPVQRQQGIDFIAALTADPQATARIEAERLSEYLKAFSRMLSGELARNPDGHKPLAPHIDMQELVKPAGLRKLFNRVAATTGNVILSEMMIAPHSFTEDESVIDGYDLFFGAVPYVGGGFKLGFMQSYTKADARGQRGSVSVPVFTFSDLMLKVVAPYDPQRMLAAFQVVMSAGNHDMQHHYSSRVLNENISQASQGEHFKTNWTGYFADSMGDVDPVSYESWLMLSHARVRRMMEAGPEGRALAAAVDIFFDELGRVSRACSANTDHVGVGAEGCIEYFSTALCFALMRFVPFDHPLQKRALGHFAALMQPYRDSLSMDRLAAAKQEEIAGLGQWIVDLMSPVPANGQIKQVQSRVERVAVDMVGVFAETSGLLPDGRYTYDLEDDQTVSVSYQAGVLHDDAAGAALIAKLKSGYCREQFFKEGHLFLTRKKYSNGSFEEVYTENGETHRADGPAATYIGSDGSRKEHYYLNGERYRSIEIETSGLRIESYYLDGQRHRAEGPAVTYIRPNGSRTEVYWLNHERHRIDGPAILYYAADGSIEKEFWKRDGKDYTPSDAEVAAWRATLKTASLSSTVPAPIPSGVRR